MSNMGLSRLDRWKLALAVGFGPRPATAADMSEALRVVLEHTAERRRVKEGMLRSASAGPTADEQSAAAGRATPPAEPLDPLCEQMITSELGDQVRTNLHGGNERRPLPQSAVA